MNLEKLKSFLQTSDVEVFAFSTHVKASEMYVEVSFTDIVDGFV